MLEQQALLASFVNVWLIAKRQDEGAQWFWVTLGIGTSHRYHFRRLQNYFVEGWWTSGNVRKRQKVLNLQYLRSQDLPACTVAKTFLIHTLKPGHLPILTIRTWHRSKFFHIPRFWLWGSYYDASARRDAKSWAWNATQVGSPKQQTPSRSSLSRKSPAAQLQRQ